MNQLDTIPIINISAFILNKDPSAKEVVAGQINFACKTFGFFYIIGHGIDEQLQENLEKLSRQFFSQPLQVKNEIPMELGGRAWRGYFPCGGELTSGRPDMKEGIYFGAELEDDHPNVQARLPLHGKNIFPSNIPLFREIVLEYINQMTRLGHQIMRAIALSLDLEENYFESLFTAEPLPLFRIFNYPALQDARTETFWGVGEHCDYGILTILKQDELGGLEVKARLKSEWIQAPPVKGSFICNIGDMLDRMTGGLYTSTPHRVHSPKSNKDRISFPFFFDPNFNSEVKMISELNGQHEIIDDREERWDKASVHEWEGTYGDYLLSKVSKCFPQLRRNVL